MKFCNQGNKSPEGDWFPLNYLFFVNTFESTDKSKYFQSEHFKRGDMDVRTDTLVATRTVLNDSARFVFYSIGFDAFAGDIPRYYLLQRCIMWCVEDMAPDGAQVQVDPLRLDYSYVAPGDTLTQDLVVKNIGNQPLIIEEISFFDDADGVFKLTKGGFLSGSKTVTLKTGQTYSVSVLFQPKEKRAYLCTLTIKSNSVYNNYKDVDVVGTGLRDISGPKLAIGDSAILNFGLLTVAKKELPIRIYNKGESDLIISKFEIIGKDSSAFNFPLGMKLPFSISGGRDTTKIVRFSLRTEKRVYSAQIHLVCNAGDSPDTLIQLIGEIGDPGYVSDGNTGSNDGLFQMEVAPNPAIEKSILTYKLLGNNSKALSIKLFDLNGQKISDIYNGDLLPGEYSYNLKTSNLPAGTYLITAQYGDQKLVLNVIVL